MYDYVLNHGVTCISVLGELVSRLWHTLNSNRQVTCQAIQTDFVVYHRLERALSTDFIINGRTVLMNAELVILYCGLRLVAQSSIIY